MLQEHTVHPGQHAALMREVSRLPGVSLSTPILDLGCGTGAWLKRLSDNGYHQLWGVDRDAGAFGAGNAAHHIAADLDSIGDALDRYQGTFGLVTIIEVIEHVLNPHNLVAIASRALSPGGWILITSPNIYSIRARMRFLLSGALSFFERDASSVLVEPDHLHPIVLEAYGRNIFSPIGLQVERLWTYPERGDETARWFARLATRILRLAIPERFSGDTLCILLRKPE
jgi:SAM-dependent methyltransferase